MSHKRKEWNSLVVIQPSGQLLEPISSEGLVNPPHDAEQGDVINWLFFYSASPYGAHSAEARRNDSR